MASSRSSKRKRAAAVCEICAGLTEEELLSRKFMSIAVDGWAAVAVEATPTWAYTIGLLQSFDHPELVITGRLSGAAVHLLAHTVERIRAGARFDVSTPPVEVSDCG